MQLPASDMSCRLSLQGLIFLHVDTSFLSVVLYSASQLHHTYIPRQPATSASGSSFLCSCGTSQSNRTSLQKLRLVCLFSAIIVCVIISVAGRAVRRSRIDHHTIQVIRCKRSQATSRESIICNPRSGGCLLINSRQPSPNGNVPGNPSF